MTSKLQSHLVYGPSRSDRLVEHLQRLALTMEVEPIEASSSTLPVPAPAYKSKGSGTVALPDPTVVDLDAYAAQYSGDFKPASARKSVCLYVKLSSRPSSGSASALRRQKVSCFELASVRSSCRYAQG